MGVYWGDGVCPPVHVSSPKVLNIFQQNLAFCYLQ